jgi:hypothetical protein
VKWISWGWGCPKLASATVEEPNETAAY